ncbi:MAG: hypothetical protein HOC71_10135 [Candidatus Latescibacteria bacterium]|jgi:vacuolar-type H+-ATPase subunit E/Vma4|nr:hypothetical protein [Candidatus Latescibacterota bacterium]
MQNPELIQIIEEKSEHSKKEILEKAVEDADAIIEKAVKTSEDMRSQALLNVQSEADSLRERRYNTIRFHTNARRYGLKSSALDKLWHEAGEALRKIERSERYKKILEDLFFECFTDVPDDSMVRTSLEDAGIVRTCIERSKAKLSLEEDAGVHSGVEFHWPDGKTVLKNTLSYRLSRLKAEGNAELSRILFSSGKETKP